MPTPKPEGRCSSQRAAVGRPNRRVSAAARVAGALATAAALPRAGAWPRWSTAFARSEDDAVRIVNWPGRLGNALQVLPGAITWAEHLGKPYVELPSAREGAEGQPGAHDVHEVFGRFEKTSELFGAFLSLPDRLPIEKSAISWGDCEDRAAAAAGLASCDSLTEDILRDHRRVMQRYVAPLLKVQPDRAGSEESPELLIHMRSGDSMSINSLSHLCRAPFNNPPCAYYDLIIETGNRGRAFDRVRIVTEPDMQNPCIEEVKRRHRHRTVEVQSKSVEEDAAAVLGARYFVTSPSLFSKMLAMMNPHLQTVWVVEGTVAPAMRPGWFACGRPGEPQLVTHRIPDLCRPWDTFASKREHMLQYPRQNIALVSTCVWRDKAAPLSAEGKVFVTFQNAGNSRVEVFAAERGMEVPMGSIAAPSGKMIFPAHQGRTFRFRQHGQVVLDHTVDISLGEKQLVWVGQNMTQPEL